MEGKTQLFKGILLVVLGAASYGVLATMVRLAYLDGYTTTEVVTAQYLIGLLLMAVLNLFVRTKAPLGIGGSAKPPLLKLAAGGISFGLIGFFYYLSVKYVPVSVAVVLLMQSIWISIVIEAFLMRKWPDAYKCIAVVTVLVGTLLATNAIDNLTQLNMTGLAWGFASGIMYAVMLLVMNGAANDMHPYRKSLWMLVFAGLTVVLIGLFSLQASYQFSIVFKWGLALAVFGPVLPMILLNIGMPKTGMGLGAILISIEIPVSVLMAYLFLQEKVEAVQWLGIVIILCSVVLVNWKAIKAKLNR